MHPFAIGEGQFGKPIAGVAAQEISGVVDGHGFLLADFDFTLHFGVVKPRGVGIECEADGVEDGGLAGACFAGDEEHVAAGQGLGIEIDDGILDGCYVVYGEFLEFHCEL